MTPQIAVQLYSVREEIKEDLTGIMRRLAQIGYAGVEGFRGMDHQAAAQACKDTGLQMVACHLSAPRGEDKAATFDVAELYGLNRIIVPWLPPERFTTAADVKAVCAELNEAGTIAAENGYSFGYHNHDFEFTPIGERQAIDIMIEELDPAVFLEIDAYWAQVGGREPNALITSLGARVPLIHIKDGPGTRDDPQVALGQGTMDLRGLAAASQAEWFVVELDVCATDMMQAIEQSYQYLVGEGLARGNR
jgi:sugar phosphate isomerase/epimerase